MLTQKRAAELAALQPLLEEQYQIHTERLAAWTAQASSGQDMDPATTAALMATCRKTLADLASALRHLAEGRYGDCECCGQPIPVERLQILPQARRCVPCQQRP